MSTTHQFGITEQDHSIGIWIYVHTAQERSGLDVKYGRSPQYWIVTEAVIRTDCLGRGCKIIKLTDIRLETITCTLEVKKVKL